MAVTKLDSRFFESTRGKIVTALRSGGRTVNELAEQFNLSDNAIRAHLLTLERDGLVMPGGTVKGYRKPHFVFILTPEARHIFPKFYDSLFNRLLDVVKSHLPISGLITILEEVGQNIGSARAIAMSEPLEMRVENALEALKELGGDATVATEGDHLLIQSSGCPFADAVIEHPEVCKVAESLVQEIVGQPVRETCDRSSAPRCRFVIQTAG
jgi:predicted ArsR family transcriptional regulator